MLKSSCPAAGLCGKETVPSMFGSRVVARRLPVPSAEYDTRGLLPGSLCLRSRCLHRILLAPLIPHRGLRFRLLPHGSQHAVPEGGEWLGEVGLPR